MIVLNGEAGGRFSFHQTLDLAKQGRLHEAPPWVIKMATAPQYDHLIPQATTGNGFLDRAVVRVHPAAGVVESPHNKLLVPALLHGQFDGFYKIPSYLGKHKPIYDESGSVFGALFRGNMVGLIEAIERHQPLPSDEKLFKQRILAEQLILSRLIEVCLGIEGKLVGMIDTINWKQYGFHSITPDQFEAGRELAHQQEASYKAAIRPARRLKESLRATKRPDMTDTDILLWRLCRKMIDQEEARRSKRERREQLKWEYRWWGRDAPVVQAQNQGVLYTPPQQVLSTALYF